MYHFKEHKYNQGVIVGSAHTLKAAEDDFCDL